MKETIYSIPINESFAVVDGECPVCRLHRKLIDDTLDYVLGSAMMEPDIRMRTNAMGFCAHHLAALAKRQKRLPLALILDTHLQTPVPIERASAGCYVCHRVRGFLTAYYANILYLWHKEADFKRRFDAQPMICRPHTAGLATAAKNELSKRELPEFLASLQTKTDRAVKALTDSLAVFTRSFDHRHANEPLGEHRLAVERAVAYMSGVS